MTDPLAEELMKRELEPLKASLDYSSRVPNDYAIRRALQILHDGGFTEIATPRLVDQYPYKNRGSQTRAFVDLRQQIPTLNVLTDTAVYKQASRNDREALIDLAAVLAHENHHVRHGSDEAGAYDTQVNVLKALGAKRKTLLEVMKAKRLTTGIK